jgi:sugar phosphate isomerase/epimerase
MSVRQTVEVASPYLGHVAIKDAVRDGKRIVFKLPGASKMFDYAHLLELLYRQGYRADICCEVSGMVWGQPGYDPLRAAADCYRAISPLFKEAGVPRR